jgi:hypothetical protein
MPRGIPDRSIDECSQIIDDWKSSGFPILEYCRKHNISLTSFRKYQQKVIRESDNSEQSHKFKEFEFRKPLSTEAEAEDGIEHSNMTISFGGNINVTLKPGFNQDEFSKVVQVLSGVLC